MKLKKVLVLVALAGAVLAATAGQRDTYERLVQSGGTLIETIETGTETEQTTMLLAGLFLIATIARRSSRRNS